MGKIFLALGLGFWIGYKELLGEKGIRRNSRMQTVFLLLLIFCMGASIGRNREVLRSLPVLGGKALLFTLFSVVGSILAAYVLSSLFLEGGKRK